MSVDTALGQSAEVTINGELVVLTDIKMRQVQEILKLTQPFLSGLGKRKEGDSLRDLLLTLFTEHADNIMQLIALLTDKEEEWVKDLSVDLGVELFAAIVERNLDFFTQRLLPLLLKSVQRVTGSLQ